MHQPSLDTPPTLLRKRSVPSDQHEGYYKNCIHKACLSCTPSKPGCIVVAWFSSPSNWELGFCRIGDSYWTELKKWDAGPRVMDFTIYNNLVYTVDIKIEVSVYDLQDRSVRNFPKQIKFYNHIRDRINLVEGDADSSGPLIVRTADGFEKTMVRAYKWCDVRQKWRPVSNFGKRAPFLNLMNSVNLQCDEKQFVNGAYYSFSYQKIQKYPNNYDAMHSLIMESFHVGIRQANLASEKVVPDMPSKTDVFSSICGLPLWVTPSLI